MAGVFRNKSKAWSPGTIFGYVFHGVFALPAMWMLMKAIS